MTEARIPLSPQLAVDQFCLIWANPEGGPLRDIAGSLTCTEAEALADLLHSFGFELAAERFIEDHAESDDEGDMHHPDYVEDDE